MARHATVEAQVIGVLHRAHRCDLEEVTGQCANLTSNQVVLSSDRLNRCGEIMLVPMGLGMYALIFPHRKDSRLDRHSPQS